jgi:hypothetical protein
MKKHKPWFGERFSKLLNDGKQDTLQQLQDPSEINADNLNNVKLKASKHFRNKQMVYLKDKNNEFAKNSNNKNISKLYRRISEFKRGYHTRNYLV